MQFKSLRTRITVWTITAMLLIPAIVGVVIIVKQFELSSVLSKTREESDAIMKTTLVRDLEHAMMVDQLDGMRAMLKKFSTFQGVRGVYLLGPEGSPVVSYGPDDPPRLDARQMKDIFSYGKEIEIYSTENNNTVRLMALPLINKEECQICHATAGVNGALIIRQHSVNVRSETNFLVAIMLISLIIASLASALTLLVLLTRNVVDPIRELSSITRKVGQCDLNVKAPTYGEGEVGDLARSFNGMIDDLKKARDEVEERSDTCRQAYLSLQAAQKRLIQSEKLATIGTLVAGIAHEINNPVGIIAARTDCMIMEAKDTMRDSQFLDDLMVINRQTGRIADITRALLTFARHAPSELKPVDINDIVEDTVFLVTKQFQREGIKIEKYLSPKRPTALADDNRLQQVLLDLLNNARDAMPFGGTIIIGTDYTSDRVELTVADTGEGIPESVLDHIFDPFFTTKEVGKGTGLGLAVSYGIIQDFGGTIEAVSRVGEGSTFNISIPRLD